jgi:hypothetical protein
MLEAKSVDVDVMLNEFKITRKQPSAPKKSKKEHTACLPITRNDHG